MYIPPDLLYAMDNARNPDNVIPPDERKTLPEYLPNYNRESLIVPVGNISDERRTSFPVEEGVNIPSSEIDYAYRNDPFVFKKHFDVDPVTFQSDLQTRGYNDIVGRTPIENPITGLKSKTNIPEYGMLPLYFPQQKQTTFLPPTVNDLELRSFNDVIGRGDIESPLPRLQSKTTIPDYLSFPVNIPKNTTTTQLGEMPTFEDPNLYTPDDTRFLPEGAKIENPITGLKSDTIIPEYMGLPLVFPENQYSEAKAKAAAKESTTTNETTNEERKQLSLSDFDVFDVATGINLMRSVNNYMQPQPKNLRFERMRPTKMSVDRAPFKQASENVVAQGQGALNTVKENTGSVTSLMGAAAQVGANVANAQNQIGGQYSQTAQQVQGMNAQMQQQAEGMNTQIANQEITTNQQMQMQAAQAKKSATDATLNAALVAQAQKKSYLNQKNYVDMQNDVQAKMYNYQYGMEEYQRKLEEKQYDIAAAQNEAVEAFNTEFGEGSDYESKKREEFESSVSFADVSVYDKNNELKDLTGEELVNKKQELYNKYINELIYKNRIKRLNQYNIDNKTTQQDIIKQIVGDRPEAPKFNVVNP